MSGEEIRLEGLTKRFEQFTISLDLSIPRGSLVTILGPSGCGKSTTLSLLTGIIAPDSGRILIGDRDITREAIHTRRIGYVFQDYALFEHMDVGRNIGYGLLVKGTPKREVEQRVDELLRLVQLSGYQDRSVTELSGGEKQRVALARAVAVDPDLLLLDEPLSALDAKLRVAMRAQIMRIHRELGLSTIYVTHDQSEALAISDMVVLMKDGQIEQVGTPQEIYREPKTLFAATFIGNSSCIPNALLAQSEDQGTLVFRPEHVEVREAPSGSSGVFCFPDARLLTQQFAGRYYECTFLWRGLEIAAYSEHCLQEDHPWVLEVKRDDARYLS